VTPGGAGARTYGTTYDFLYPRTQVFGDRPARYGIARNPLRYRPALGYEP
jgi:hypothetical protein